MFCCSSGCAGVAPEVKPVGGKPAPLLRSRTLPAIVVPGLNILQAQIDARYKQGKYTLSIYVSICAACALVKIVGISKANFVCYSSIAMISTSLCRVIQEERSMFWYVIVSVIARKNVYMNICVILHGYRYRVV
jgi:hypothetical protein